MRQKPGGLVGLFHSQKNQGFVGAVLRVPAQPIDERVGVSDIGALHEGIAPTRE